ncbi:MAG: ATP-binding protein [Candidatus Thermoplasmatota archaeon]
MDYSLFIPISSTVFTLLIALYVLFVNHEKKSHIFFSLLVLFFAVFSLTELLVRISPNVSTALLWSRLCYSVIAIAPVVLINFLFLYPQNILDEKNFGLKNSDFLKFLYPTGVFLYVLFNLFVSPQNVVESQWGYRVVLGGVTSPILISWFLFCIIFATANFIKSYYLGDKILKKSEKKQMRLLTFGIIVVVTLTTGTNLIPPLFGLNVFPMASLSLLLFSAIVGYAMMKYGFMELSPTETADIIVDTMSDSLIVTNEDKKIVNANRSALTLLGYTNKELRGKDIDKILSLSSRRNEKTKREKTRFLADLLSNKKLEGIDAKLLTKDGKQIPANISATAIYDNDEFRGILITARDLTEIKRLVDELKEAKENLEEKVEERTKNLIKTNRELIETKEELMDLNENLEEKVEKRTEQVRKLLKQKEEFINQLGHDLKTPLTPLNTLLPMIKENVDDEKTEERLEVAIGCVNYMRDLVSKTLYLAKLNSSEIKFDTDEVNLQSISKSVVSKHQINFEEKNLEFKNEINKDLFVEGDELRLEELFDNLISNAAKYTPGGGKIILHAEEQKEEIKIAVQDDGLGMTEEEATRIFDEFYKADASRHDVNSTGLGLTISKRIVEEHGGKIWAESNGRGEGSTFYFTLKKAEKDKE